MPNYTRLTTSQAAETRRMYAKQIEASKQRRAEVLMQRDLEQAFRALHWGPNAALELAAIHARELQCAPTKPRS